MTMRYSMLFVVNCVLGIFMTTSMVLAGGNYGDCYTPNWIPPGTQTGSCGPCESSWVGGYVRCAGTGAVVKITTGYTICSTSQTGGSTCTGTWAVVGTSTPCELVVDTGVVAACLLAAKACEAACAVPISPQCVACLGAYGVACTGCNIRDCVLDATKTTLITRYTKNVTGTCP